MKNHSRLLMGVFVALLSIFLLAGCSTSAVVATVNGEDLNKGELDKRVDRYKLELAARGVTADNKDMLSMIEMQELERMIDEKIYEQEAKKLNIQVSDEQVEEELALEKMRFQSEEEYQEALKHVDLTDGEFREIIRTGIMLFELFEHITADIEVAEDEMRQYYEAHPERFIQKEQVEASHILVESEEEAMEIIARLQAGADFAELAFEKSIDQASGQRGGSLGYFVREDMVEEFADAAFSLPVGQFTQKPVPSLFGYHIILVHDKEAEKKLTYEEAKEQLVIDLPTEKKVDKFESWFEEVKSNADIDRKIA
ncbi:foldase [Heliorestis acidaminivorans]|uniref:Foldase n=1 Tax=Heliorestis acidaminivorans TaxID=553427 RepID=A0A6I0ERP2_9FIRM|nr:peptidylprolyl isomerase [Heliorestis acidaminivorans]KAB2953039.1 foldase [Heliorestis acidaminivorans]